MVTYAFSEPRLLKAILAMVQAEEVHPCCYSSRDCLAAMQNHWGHTSMGLLTSPRAGWWASRSLSSCGGGALVSSGLSVGYWVVDFLDKGLGPEVAALCRSLPKPGGFVSRSKSAKSITLLARAAFGADKSIITVNSLWMKSGPTKVSSWTTIDFTGTRFYPDPWSAPGSSPMLSAAIHSSSEGKDGREQRRVLVLAQLSLSPAQPAVLRIILW